ncbi:MAG TPA: hypothetical protein VFW19_07755 [Allosphingosinicella sp.]|nr:hypothetical protein [Allosphingosinicella sp.]
MIAHFMVDTIGIALLFFGLADRAGSSGRLSTARLVFRLRG